MMIAWLAVTAVLMVWNAIYCAQRVLRDWRGPAPASGVWGLFALLGAMSVLALGAVGLMVAGSGI